MIDWSASIFREAGADPTERRDGVEEMAKIVAFARLWMGLAGLAEESKSTRSLEVLNAFDRGNLVPVLDIMYPAVMRTLAV